MHEKDISEKTLEDYNDVFADIVNVLLFHGEKKVSPSSLSGTGAVSQYKADDAKLHEQERDVSKVWKKARIRIAIFGIENQTKPDKDMPLRVIGYDGSSYRSQLLSGKEERYPVVTLVLYFGKEKWSNTRLYDCFTIPKGLRPYVNDYRINLFKIRKLSRKQVDMFQSDFKIVADYFYQMEHTKDYNPSADKVKHVDEVMKLLRVLSGDERFELPSLTAKEKKGGVTMEQWLSKKIQKSEEIGEKRGREIGEKQGEKKGKMELLFFQVRDGVISKKQAAQYAGVTPQTFSRKMKAAGY